MSSVNQTEQNPGILTIIRTILWELNNNPETVREKVNKEAEQIALQEDKEYTARLEKQMATVKMNTAKRGKALVQQAEIDNKELIKGLVKQQKEKTHEIEKDSDLEK